MKPVHLPASVIIIVANNGYSYASAFTSDINVMIGAGIAGVFASAFVYEKHPLSITQQTKEASGVDGQSDTELRAIPTDASQRPLV